MRMPCNTSNPHETASYTNKHMIFNIIMHKIILYKVSSFLFSVSGKFRKALYAKSNICNKDMQDVYDIFHILSFNIDTSNRYNLNS